MGKWSGESINRTKDCSEKCRFFVAEQNEIANIIGKQLTLRQQIKRGIVSKYLSYAQICIYSQDNFKLIVDGAPLCACFKFKREGARA